MASLGDNQDADCRSTYSTVMATNVPEPLWNAPSNDAKVFLTECVNKSLGDQARLLNITLSPSKHSAVLKVQGELEKIKTTLGPTDSTLLVPMYSIETSATLCFIHANFAKEVLEVASKYLLRCSSHDGKVTVTGGIHNINLFLSDLDNVMQDLLIEHQTAIPRSTEGVLKDDLQEAPAEGTQLSDLSPDVLALLEKTPDGRIPSVVYSSKAGSVSISNHKDVAAFQSAYQGIANSDRQKSSCVPIPGNLNGGDVAGCIAEYNEKYNLCNFSVYEGTGVVKVFSLSARQLNQAVKLLGDELNHLAFSNTPTTFEISSGRLLTLKKADIVQEEVEVIVNAANERLIHGGGVAGAIDRASHGSVQAHSNVHVQNHGCVPVGGLAITYAGGALKCKHVFHVVGPTNACSPNECRRILQHVIRSTLCTAEKYDILSIAFPAVSAGIFSVDKEIVSQSIIDAILHFRYTKAPPVLHDIRIVIIDKPTHQTFAHYFSKKIQGPLAIGGSSASVSVATDRSLTSESFKNTSPPATSSQSGASSPAPIIDAVRQNIKYASQGSPALLLTSASNSATPVSSTEDQATLVDTTEHKEEEVLVAVSDGDHKKSSQLHSNEAGSLKAAGNMADSSTVSESNLTAEARGGVQKAQKFAKKAKKQHSVSESQRRKDNECPICLEKFNSPTTTKCGHQFCKKCLSKHLSYSPYCPVCKAALLSVFGNQPANGTMSWKVDAFALAGHERYGTTEITYHIPDGVQLAQHPSPGCRYHGTTRTAYLPYNQEGKEVLGLLKRAFDCGLIFTVGTSVTSGKPNTVVWNDIHHKTSRGGGPSSYGYPDATYLRRVKADLAAKGICHA